MIGSLEGRVELKDNPHLIVNVNGVGYRVLVPGKVLSKLQINDQVKLFIHTHVREDAFDLYGFLSLDELKLFEKFISVSGVGPKTAASIFSFGDKDEIIQAIINSNVAFFTSVPRLGRKNAQKIIIELKSKLDQSDSLSIPVENTKENNELIAVLKNFGFTAAEAREAIKNIQGKEGTIEEKVKLALKYLGK